MVPVPYTVQTALAHPLQKVATVASTYLLETLGFPAYYRGNIIFLNETKVGVVEACNGLSMLVIFFALSTAIAILTSGGWVYRAAALLSAIPIALVSNILRISVTAVLYETVGAEAGRVFFHDFAGWLMMPLGLMLLGMEFLLLRWLLTEPDTEGAKTGRPNDVPPVVNLPRSGPPRAARQRENKVVQRIG
jgi:exosortase